MATLQEIRDSITYVQGPQGQTVVIVPTKLKEDKVEKSETWIWVVVIVLGILTPICLSVGIVYGRFVLFVKNAKKNDKYEDFVIAAIALTAIGVTFVIIIIALVTCRNRLKLTQIRKFMNKDTFQDIEERDLEEYGARYERLSTDIVQQHGRPTSYETRF